MPAAIEAGRTVTLTIKTNPGAHLSIEVQDLALSQFPNLQDKTADSQGNATWTFHVDHNYRADLLPIIVSATVDGGSADKLVTQIPVVKGPASKAEQFPLAVVSEVPAARAGGRVNLTVKTAPGAKVSIEAQGAGFPQLSSLFEQTAGADGVVMWDWQIRENYEADKMPVIVTSDYGDGEEKIVSAIKVLPGNVEPPVSTSTNANGNGENNGTMQAPQSNGQKLAGKARPAMH